MRAGGADGLARHAACPHIDVVCQVARHAAGLAARLHTAPHPAAQSDNRDRDVYRQDGYQGSGSWTRLGWEDVARVSGDDGARVLTLAGFRDDGPPQMTARLSGHVRLAETNP
jgi:hypothetical protein